MPFVQRVVEPKFLSKTSLWLEDGKPKIDDHELEAVTNNTLSNALRQLASLLLVAEDIFTDLGNQLQDINQRSEALKTRISNVDKKVTEYDPKKVSVPESDICTFALRKDHFARNQEFSSNLFAVGTRPASLKALYSAASKTPVAVMRQLDRWRRDGHRSSRFFLCTPVLGQKRKRIKCNGDIEIETAVPAAVEELRRWTSTEALGDITVTPDCSNRIPSNLSHYGDAGDATDGTVVSDDEGIDHKLPSPEEQVQVVALKFPSEIVTVDISGKPFARMSLQRRSLMNGEIPSRDGDTEKKKSRTRKPRSKRRNTLAGTDQKEIENAVAGGDPQPTTSTATQETITPPIKIVGRSKSSDILRTNSKKDKESPENKRSHFNTLKQWSKNRYDRFMNRSNEDKSKERDIDEFNLYETVTMKRRRNIDKKSSSHQRSSSVSSSEKSTMNLPVNTALSGVMNLAVRLRESSLQKRERRKGKNKDEPHSSSGNWSASSESGRNSIGSEITTSTGQPKSTTSEATSSNSLNIPVSNFKRRFVSASGSSSVTSEGTLTPDIIHDLHEDGETSSVYSCDTEGYYTSFHMDSGLKTLKEEDAPMTPLHSSNTLDNPSSSAENEYELFGKGSTSTTTSSAGTICTTLKASESNRSLVIGPAVPERKSSLGKSPESSLERDASSDKTGTVKRSPATTKAFVEDKRSDGGVSPDSGHNTSSSPIESTSSPNGVRSCSEFEFSESSDMEGAERIERIRVKTTINSSRIPSMCVITPSQSDDESSQSSHNSNKDTYNSENDKFVKNQIKGTDKYINIDQRTGYATLETIHTAFSDKCTDINQNTASINTNNSVRAPSPSGGTVIIREEVPIPKATQPIFKSPLLPFNTMFDKIKSNFSNLKSRKEDKSPNRSNSLETNDCDLGEYVTITDVRNNNNNNNKTIKLNKEDTNTHVQDVVNRNLKTILSGKVRETEYVSLNELPCNETIINNPLSMANNDSLERKKRQGARVTLDAEGKVVYSSDSLKRKKGHQSTFEPGPFVKTTSPKPSPLPTHRIPKNVRAVTHSERGIPDGSAPPTPQLGKIIIKASSDDNPEFVRMPPTTIVGPNTRPMSPKATGRGAYVHVQNAGKPQEKDRVPTSPERQMYQSVPEFGQSLEMSRYQTVFYDRNPSHFYHDQQNLGRGTQYQTLPTKKTQLYLAEIQPERSVTPDITRGLERNGSIKLAHPGFDSTKETYFHDENFYRNDSLLNQKLGIPVSMPSIKKYTPTNNIYSNQNYTPQYNSTIGQQYQSFDEVDAYFKISPIDPRNSGGFQSSTPSQTHPLRSAINLESRIASPKKTTMSNEELYAVIHKSKKKLNISTDDEHQSLPERNLEHITQIEKVKSPESGYLGEKIRTRLSWSPSNTPNEDDAAEKNPRLPTNESRNRQSWACNDRKKTGQTSRLDFKKLLLQKSGNLLSNTKKPSAVEQLKLSKQQIQQKQFSPSVHPPEMNILELSGSPRSLVNRRFQNPPGSPKNCSDKLKPPKLMSPKSQWRFASPRSDVLSSTILEDCREDETNSSGEKKPSPVRLEDRFNQNPNEATQSTKPTEYKSEQNQKYLSIAQKIQAQRAEFFKSGSTNCSQFKEQQTTNETSKAPTLETSF